MKKTEKTKKNVLAKRMLVGMVILAVVLIFGMGFYVSGHYRNVRLKQVQSLAFSYARTLARMIDGDRAKEIIENKDKNQYYYEVYQTVRAFAEESEDILFALVIVPREDDFLYIWDSDISMDIVSSYQFDYYEPYEKGAKEVIDRAYRNTPDEEIRFYRTKLYGYLAEAPYPICDSSGNPVAVCTIDISATNIEQEQQDFVIGNMYAIGTIILLACVLFYVVIITRVVKPIEKIDDAARSFVKNIDSSYRLVFSTHTGDEIGSLSRTFETMSEEVSDYISRLSSVTAEKERIRAELDIAANIQASILPSVFPAFPERSEFDICATMTPAREVGGDFYDFFMVDDTHLAMVAADVSGKGVPAALFMAIGKTLIKDHTTPGADLGEVFTTVNNLLCDENSEGFFITAFEGVLDLVTGEFRFVNAGHEPPFLCRKGEKFTLYPIRPGFVLAGMEDMRYHASSVLLEPGDKLFEYTDGVTEAANRDEQLFGLKRLEQSLVRYSDKSVHELLPLVKADVDAFVGDAPQFDDITMICFEFFHRMDRADCQKTESPTASDGKIV